MSDNNSEIHSQLKRLAERLQIGRQALHPATDQDYQTVLNIVREQWRKEQPLEKSKEENGQTSALQETEEKTRSNEVTRSQRSSQSPATEDGPSKSEDSQGQSGSHKATPSQSHGESHSH